MIVLDTHAVIWDALATKKLSAEARRRIEQADAKGELLVSDISLWEIAMLVRRKRIEIDETPGGFIRLILQARRYRVKAISPAIADASVTLGDGIDADPADRLIVATALTERCPLLTADSNLRRAKVVETLW